MATKQDVSFTSPQAMIAPDLTVEMQRIQRQQDLADALRAQSFQQIDPGRGAISWTQGAAKLAEALAGNILHKRADKKQAALYQDYSHRMGGMFGHPSLPPGASVPSAQGPMDPGMSMPPTEGGGPVSPPNGGPSSGGSPALPPIQLKPQIAAQLTPEAQAGLNAVNGQSAPQPAPQPPAQQGGWEPGPMSLTGDQQRDMAMYSMNPEEYQKAVIAASAPVDTAKTVAQAKMAMARGDYATATALMGQITKNNYIAPINGRPGATIRDPLNPQRVLGYDAPTIEGAFPTYDANGMPTGYQAAPGASGAIGAAAGAKAGATASAQAPFELVEVVDDKGNKHLVPKSALTGGGGMPPPSGTPSPAPTSTPTGSPTGKPVGNMSGLGPGQTAADAEGGKNSANAFNDVVQRGQNVPNAQRTLDTIMTAANGLQTGRGADTMSGLKSGFNTITGTHAFDPRDIAKFDEIKKNAASLAGQLSSGPTGTDARLNNAIEQLPNANYSPKAIRDVGYMLKGKIAGDQAASQAAAVWMQQHGPNSYPEFQTTFQQAYDPEMFEAMQRDHDQKGVFKSWLRQIGPSRRAEVVTRLQRLKSLGVSF